MAKEEKLSAVEVVEWLWSYLGYQGFDSSDYVSDWALQDVASHSKLFPASGVAVWYRSASSEERALFRASWDQKLRAVGRFEKLPFRCSWLL